MHHPRTLSRLVTALSLVSLGGCRGATEVVPSGACLLNVSLASGAQMPDELTASVSDDTGALWTNQRFPASGPLVPLSATELGSILIEPGAISGDLRIKMQGLLRGVLIDEATLTIPHASYSGGTFDLTLSGVPADAGAGDAPVDAPVAGGGRDASQGEQTGSNCASASECASGFCKDGICCNSPCTSSCESCATGSCMEVKSGQNVPECVSPMTCNKMGKCVAASSMSGG